MKTNLTVSRRECGPVGSRAASACLCSLTQFALLSMRIPVRAVLLCHEEKSVAANNMETLAAAHS
jgi:hypothetical protein